MACLPQGRSKHCVQPWRFLLAASDAAEFVSTWRFLKACGFSDEKWKHGMILDFGWCWIPPVSETASQNLSAGLEDMCRYKIAILGMCPISGHAHKHEVKKSWKQKKSKKYRKTPRRFALVMVESLKVGHVSLQMAFQGACDSSWLITNYWIGLNSKNGIQTKRHDEMIKEEFLVTAQSHQKKSEPLNTTINHYLGSALGWWWICSPRKCELYHGRFPANDVLLSCLSTGGYTQKTHIELKNCRCSSAEHRVFQIPFLRFIFAFRTLNHNLSIHVPLQPRMRTSCSLKIQLWGQSFRRNLVGFCVFFKQIHTSWPSLVPCRVGPVAQKPWWSLLQPGRGTTWNIGINPTAPNTDTETVFRGFLGSKQLLREYSEH